MIQLHGSSSPILPAPRHPFGVHYTLRLLSIPRPAWSRMLGKGSPSCRRSSPSPCGLASSRLEPKPCIDPRCILNPAAAEASGFQRQGGGVSPWASRLWHRSETPGLLPQPVPPELAQGPCPHQRFNDDAQALSVGKGPLGCCGVPGVALDKGIQRVMYEQEWGVGMQGYPLLCCITPTQE